jgi:hypothetical protein
MTEVLTAAVNAAMNELAQSLLAGVPGQDDDAKLAALSEALPYITRVETLNRCIELATELVQERQGETSTKAQEVLTRAMSRRERSLKRSRER